MDDNEMRQSVSPLALTAAGVAGWFTVELSGSVLLSVAVGIVVWLVAIAVLEGSFRRIALREGK